MTRTHHGGGERMGPAGQDAGAGCMHGPGVCAPLPHRPRCPAPQHASLPTSPCTPAHTPSCLALPTALHPCTHPHQLRPVPPHTSPPASPSLLSCDPASLTRHPRTHPYQPSPSHCPEPRHAPPPASPSPLPCAPAGPLPASQACSPRATWVRAGVPCQGAGKS